jgi:hypothetical protein
MIDDLKMLYENCGGTDFNPTWTTFEIWKKIAELNSIEINDCYTINDILKKIEENL